ncbi:MAG: RNA methyltransferase [Bacteroidales bacterium]|nr:RNA methyltransferase [Bacteroidales bacterium]
MNYPAEPFDIIVKTFSGLEYVLKTELETIGAKDCTVINRGVKCTGGLKTLYEANYLCRTALRVLVPVAEFEVNSEDDLYHGIYRMNWPDHLSVGDTFAIEAVTSYSTLTHSKYIALKAKDAVADSFRNKYGKRPDVDTDNPVLRINIRVFRSQCSVSLDSSGDSLHKRGYRISTGPAPINEVLAAGMIMLTGWQGDTDFVDPMCGSGTIPIEAALIAKKIPPGYFRNSFGFEKWRGYDHKLFENIKTEAKKNIRPLPAAITGSDMSGRILSVARENVRNAGLERDIRLRVGFFADSKPPSQTGMLVMNPPYGERITSENTSRLYSEIGDTLKKRFSGYEAWILSADLEALKNVGLHPSRKIKLFNGQLECRFMKFDLYTGSKKQKET